MSFFWSIIIWKIHQYHTLRKIKVYFVRKLFLGGPSPMGMGPKGFVSYLVMFCDHTKQNIHRDHCEMCSHFGISKCLSRCHRNVRIEEKHHRETHHVATRPLWSLKSNVLTALRPGPTKRTCNRCI